MIPVAIAFPPWRACEVEVRTIHPPLRYHLERVLRDMGGYLAWAAKNIPGPFIQGEITRPTLIALVTERLHFSQKVLHTYIFVFGINFPKLHFSYKKYFSGINFRKLHITYSFMMQGITWKHCLGINFLEISFQLHVIMFSEFISQ